MLLAPLGLLVVYWVVATIIIFLDPFDIYSWGIRTPVDLHNTTDDNRYLVDAVAKDPTIDLVMVGSSTAMPYSPEDLRRAYPDSLRPYNLSYDAARPVDRTAVINTIADRSKAKRLVVWLDWSYAMPKEAQNPTFPSYMYDSSRYNDLRMVNETAFGASVRILRGRNPFADYPKRLAVRNLRWQQSYAEFQSPAAMRTLASKIRMYRPTIDRPGAKGCSSLSALDSGLVEPLRKWAMSGRPADVIIPAYSPAFYFDRGDPASGLRLADQLMLRRCLVLQTAGFAGVRIFALDADAQLTGNLSNYKDPGHLFGQGALGIALNHIAKADLIVGPKNVESYLGSLRLRVVNYEIDARRGGPS